MAAVSEDSYSSRKPLLADPFEGTNETENKTKEQEQAVATTSTRRVYLRRLSALLMTLVIFSFAALQKTSPIPDPFKHLKYGRIDYFTEDTDYGREYHREIKIPCMYGLLTFAVAPAAKNLPYMFDVYNDEFTYHDAICPLRPTRLVKKTSSEPFLMPGDPTTVKAKFTYITRISTKVVHPVNAKSLPEPSMAAFAGDYVVVASGKFYNADVYRQLIGIVHNWTDTSVGSLQSRFLELNFSEESE